MNKRGTTSSFRGGSGFDCAYFVAKLNRGSNNGFEESAYNHGLEIKTKKIFQKKNKANFEEFSKISNAFLMENLLNTLVSLVYAIDLDNTNKPSNAILANSD